MAIAVVVDHGTHFTVEDLFSEENLGATVGHPRFITRSGAENWAKWLHECPNKSSYCIPEDLCESCCLDIHEERGWKD